MKDKNHYYFKNYIRIENNHKFKNILKIIFLLILSKIIIEILK
jgi:hypothetical protein